MNFPKEQKQINFLAALDRSSIFTSNNRFRTIKSQKNKIDESNLINFFKKKF